MPCRVAAFFDLRFNILLSSTWIRDCLVLRETQVHGKTPPIIPPSCLLASPAVLSLLSTVLTLIIRIGYYDASTYSENDLLHFYKSLVYSPPSASAATSTTPETHDPKSLDDTLVKGMEG